MTDKQKPTIQIPYFYCDRCHQHLSAEMQELIRQCCEKVANETGKAIVAAVAESISREMEKLIVKD